MSKTATKPSTNGKPKQAFLPKMAPKTIPDLDKLADDFYEAKFAEKLAKQEAEKKGDLLHMKMKDRKLKSYRTANGRWVHVDLTEKVKVTKAEAEKGAGNA